VFLIGHMAFHTDLAVDDHWLGLELAGSLQLQYALSGSPDKGSITASIMAGGRDRPIP
jgi:hypothetical protein